MKKRSVTCAVLLAIALIVSPDVLCGEQQNLFSTTAGARIVSFSSNYEGSWDVSNLIGGSEDWAGDLPAWCTAQNAPFPHWVVIELPRQTWLTTLIFNNFIPDESGGWPGISARDVQLQVSNVNATDGFITVASFQLERNKNNQEVRVEPAQGRWVKVIVTSNWGNEEYTELGKLGAFDDGSRPSNIAQELKSRGFVDTYGIYFDFGSAVVRSESAPIIDNIARFLKDNPSTKLSIEGHTDNIGDSKSNQVLSENRAKSVAAAVTQAGIPAGRLTSVGYGMSRPIGENKTITGRARNRRVTLRVVR